MGLGTFPKKFTAWAGHNARVGWNFMHSTPVGASYARWAAAGAALGGIYGLSDNVFGEDRVSVLGGMVQGAMLGGAARGIGSLWSMKGKLKGITRPSNIPAGARNLNVFRGATMANTPTGQMFRNIAMSSRGRAGTNPGYYGR